MSWHIVPLAGIAPQPWKNGGGSTRELLAWPAGGEWRVRLSVAEVAQDGPFSVFEGVHRCFAVLEGEGVTLVVEGVERVLTKASEPFAFDGAVPLDCTLVDGATQDFNLMVRGGVGSMWRVQGSFAPGVAAGTIVAVYATAMEVVLHDGVNETYLPPATLAWQLVDDDTSFAVEGDDALWMEIKS